MATHALFSASSSHRWMTCTASISMSDGVEKSSSVYAREGTAAHSLGEACLRSGDDPFNHVGEEIVVEGDKFTVDEGMAEAVQLYVQTVLADYDGKTDVLAVEQRFDLSRFHPNMFGTCDAVVYKPATKKLTVFDLKYGRGYAVDAEDNPQLKFYGLGACIAGEGWPVDEVELVIVQPRAQHPKGPVRRWSTDAMTLIDFSSDIVAAAKAALGPNPRIISGEHCTFCPAAGKCPELREKSLAIAEATFAAHPLDWQPPAPEELTKEQLAAVLIRAELVKDWIGAVQAHAHMLAEGGDVLPGFKLVDKRATRRWANEAAAKEFAAKQVGEVHVDSLFTEPEFKSPAQIEAALMKALRISKKDAATKLAPYVSKESSGTNLVRDADARPEVKAAVLQAFTPIKQITTENKDWLA